MRLIRTMRRQVAVYWAINSASAAYDSWGQQIFVTPVEIECRWGDVIEEFIDMDGVRQLSQSKVYVDRDMELGGYLLLGALADLSSVEMSAPKTNKNAWEIKRFDKLPTLKATKYLRTVYL